MSSRGITRERQVRDYLTANNWVVIRAAGSLGDCDLVALQKGYKPLLIEVKSTSGGPYERFQPHHREHLKQIAEWAGAVAVLAWWPSRGKLRWIYSEEWPTPKPKKPELVVVPP